MANGKLLRQLIKSGLDGDTQSFRDASQAVIREERDKNHHLLANDLERLLYADRAPLSLRTRSGLAALPTNKDSGLPLLEERPVIREERDLVVSVSTKAALDEVLLEHNRADLLRSYGVQPSTKLLFCGPPGCGKTLAAEVLAHSLSVPLMLVRLDTLISSLLGETASNLRKVFDYVSENPVIALFDEFDALAKDRGDSADHGELKRAVNAVLQMMDGYRGSSILIATTNYDDLLDKAVWRRFDEVVKFEMPTSDQIQALLFVKLAGVRRSFELEDASVIKMLNGFSHADVERILRRAVKEMLLTSREFLDRAHIESAVKREHRD